MGRRGKRRKQLLDYLKKMRENSKLKEIVKIALWRTRFGTE